MARVPIEVPLTVIRNHPNVRYLTASAYGCYVRILVAIFHDGMLFDQLTDVELMNIAQAPSGTWKRIVPTVMKALRETLGPLTEEHNRRVVKRAKAAAFFTKASKSRIWDKDNKVSLADSPNNPSRDAVLLPQKQPQKEKPRQSWSDQVKINELKAAKRPMPTFLTESNARKTDESNS